MLKRIIPILFIFSSFHSIAQELNADVQVLTPGIQTTDRELIPNLQKAVENFINATTWTEELYDIEEKIRCSFVITVNSISNRTNFSASIQINYSRPIYNSNYDSPVLNYIDNDFNFTYIENEPLEYVQNSYSSNLSSVLSFYANVIIGLDKDTYSFKGGDQYYQIAQNIVNMSQSEGGKGWRSFDGSKNRFWLIDNIMNAGFIDFRHCLYNYHRLGLDNMYDASKQLEAKQKISSSITSLRSIYEKRPNAFILQVFFDAKNLEIISIFKDGPNMDTEPLVSTLKKIDAGRSSKYQGISR